MKRKYVLKFITIPKDDTGRFNIYSITKLLTSLQNKYCFDILKVNVIETSGLEGTITVKCKPLQKFNIFNDFLSNVEGTLIYANY